MLIFYSSLVKIFHLKSSRNVQQELTHKRVLERIAEKIAAELLANKNQDAFQGFNEIQLLIDEKKSLLLARQIVEAHFVSNYSIPTSSVKREHIIAETARFLIKHPNCHVKPSDGGSGGVYMIGLNMQDPLLVFKPSDEEPGMHNYPGNLLVESREFFPPGDSARREYLSQNLSNPENQYAFLSLEHNAFKYQYEQNLNVLNKSFPMTRPKEGFLTPFIPNEGPLMKFSGQSDGDIKDLTASKQQLSKETKLLANQKSHLEFLMQQDQDSHGATRSSTDTREVIKNLKDNINLLKLKVRPLEQKISKIEKRISCGNVCDIILRANCREMIPDDELQEAGETLKTIKTISPEIKKKMEFQVLKLGIPYDVKVKDWPFWERLSTLEKERVQTIFFEDMRTCNADGNLGNLLLSWDGAQASLTGIDRGRAYPTLPVDEDGNPTHLLDDIQLNLIGTAPLKQPIHEALKTRILKLNPMEEREKLIAQQILPLTPPAVDLATAQLIFIQSGVTLNKDLNTIAKQISTNVQEGGTLTEAVNGKGITMDCNQVTKLFIEHTARLQHGATINWGKFREECDAFFKDLCNIL